MTELLLNGLEVECVIGDRPEERERPQRLVVDISLEVDPAAFETDRLEDAADYAAIASRVSEALTAAKCRLVERAVKLAAIECLSHPRVRRATATVTKSGAVPGLKSAAARYTATRNPPA